jgi:hypothetical protein
MHLCCCSMLHTDALSKSKARNDYTLWSPPVVLQNPPKSDLFRYASIELNCKWTPMSPPCSNGQTRASVGSCSRGCDWHPLRGDEAVHAATRRTRAMLHSHFIASPGKSHIVHTPTNAQPGHSHSPHAVTCRARPISSLPSTYASLIPVCSRPRQHRVH